VARRFRRNLLSTTLGGIVAVILAIAPAHGACGNGVVESGEDCDDGSAENGGSNSCCTSSCTFSGESPDVIVGDIMGGNNYGTVSGITAYSFSTTSCNLGSCWLNWFEGTTDHPLIAQNMFRLKNGRLEQLGQSWLKHTYAALTGTVCATCDPPPDTTHLGVNCSDPYSSNTNGTQTNLGPKNNVNANTGVFLYPDSRLSLTGDAIYKRLQVHNTDLDPSLNSGALYFLESQYVTRDDAAAGHQTNNASYRRVTVGSSPFNLALVDTTQRQKAGIQAWKANDAAVTETMIAAPEGLFILAAKATSLGGGIYHYEYAVQNLTNQRAGQSFSVPIPAGAVITNVGFHDVDYHSSVPAELYSGIDWTPTVSGSSVSWATQTYAVNQNANALRWGTLYNFRFDASVAPGTGLVTIGLFRPGSPTTTSATTVIPGPCQGAPNGTGCSDGNLCTQTDTCQSGVCQGGNPVVCTASDPCHDVGTCAPASGSCSNPSRADGTGCNDGDPCTGNDACSGGVCVGAVIQTPAEVDNGLVISKAGATATISWNSAPGSTTYDVLRGLVSGLPVGPGGGDESCLATGIAGTSTTDSASLSPGDSSWYLARGANSCGKGPYGSQRVGGVPSPRTSSSCP
jgi:hypothetical protein